MTVNVARRTRRRTTTSTTSSATTPQPEPIYTPVDSIAIGEIDQTVFDCPNCRRPLALGARRCPGCRARLVNGVVLSKASTFVVTGLLLGVIVGGAGIFALGAGRSNGITPPVIPSASSIAASTTPTSAPAVTPASSPSTSQPAPVSDIPAVTRSAMVQALGTNDRLAAGGHDLEAALAASSFDATEVRQTLRTMSADAVFGEQVAAHVRDWPGTSEVGSQLVDFYAGVHETAAEGLVASVRNEAAYRSAAETMLELLAKMDRLEAALRAAASAGGVTLPE